MILDFENLYYPGVIDFIDIGFSQFGYRWYIFNLADTAITVGIIFYLLYAYFYEKKLTVK